MQACMSVCTFGDDSDTLLYLGGGKKLSTKGKAKSVHCSGGTKPAAAAVLIEVPKFLSCCFIQNWWHFSSTG
jgi:hypothetical protein